MTPFKELEAMFGPKETGGGNGDPVAACARCREEILGKPARKIIFTANGGRRIKLAFCTALCTRGFTAGVKAAGEASLS